MSDTFTGTDFFDHKIHAVRGREGSLILMQHGTKRTMALSAKSVEDLRKWIDETEPQSPAVGPEKKT